MKRAAGRSFGSATCEMELIGLVVHDAPVACPPDAVETAALDALRKNDVYVRETDTTARLCGAARRAATGSAFAYGPRR